MYFQESCRMQVCVRGHISLENDELHALISGHPIMKHLHKSWVTRYSNRWRSKSSGLLVPVKCASNVWPLKLCQVSDKRAKNGEPMWLEMSISVWSPIAVSICRLAKFGFSWRYLIGLWARIHRPCVVMQGLGTKKHVAKNRVTKSPWFST